MNKKISYGSIEELRALDAKGNNPHGIGLIETMGLKAFNEMMEKYDPGAKKAHKLAKKYHKKE